MRSPVVQRIMDEMEKEFDSICGAAKQLKICKSGIIKCCKHKQRQCGGFIFKYKKK